MQLLITWFSLLAQRASVNGASFNEIRTVEGYSTVLITVDKICNFVQTKYFIDNPVISHFWQMQISLTLLDIQLFWCAELEHLLMGYIVD